MLHIKKKKNRRNEWSSASTRWADDNSGEIDKIDGLFCMGSVDK